MIKKNNTSMAGFSLIELLIAMTILLVLLGITTGLFQRALGIRSRESRRTDALTSAQAALNLMSREISNSGFGIFVPASGKHDNGIIVDDSGDQRVHFRANTSNFGQGPNNPTCPAICTSDPGEDVTFFFDSATSSIVRFDPNGDPQTSVIVNRISDVTFKYFDYVVNDDGTPSITGPNDTPSANTSRVEIEVDVTLDPVSGQPNPAAVRFTSEVSLRNSPYMLRQY